MLDRDPLRTIAAMALQGAPHTPSATLEAVLAYAWNQLAQHHGDAEMARVLNKLDILDLLPDVADQANKEAMQ